LTQINVASSLRAQPRALLISVNFPLDGFRYSGSIRQEQAKETVMFFDNVVIAGVITVGLMVCFFAGLGVFIWKDSHKRKQG
jgi:hypothetical protein